MSNARETSTHLLMKLNAKGPSLYAWSAVGNGEENSNLGAGGISYVMLCFVCLLANSLRLQIRRVTKLI